MRIVAALGGNALLRRGQRPDADVQEHNVAVAVASLAPLAMRHELVITHGNGPQVGLLALESAADHSLTRPYPLAELGAETQGLIGYWLLQELQNALPGRDVAALVTQTVVAADDPAFDSPTKFVGPVYPSETEAADVGRRMAWTMRADGAAWRRVVASPQPLRIVEEAVVGRLLEAGVVVICAGGGGVPVVIDAGGRRRGVDAVIDKDLTTALLAENLGADAMLLLTDADGVIDGWGTPEATVMRSVTTTELRARRFPAGSMGPKIEAACLFVERTGKRAAIGALGQAEAVLSGESGTTVHPG